MNANGTVKTNRHMEPETKAAIPLTIDTEKVTEIGICYKVYRHLYETIEKNHQSYTCSRKEIKLYEIY